MRVLIIGAGIGGLCLAHGLKKAGIDVHIFEKQVSANATTFWDRIFQLTNIR